MERTRNLTGDDKSSSKSKEPFITRYTECVSKLLSLQQDANRCFKKTNTIYQYDLSHGVGVGHNKRQEKLSSPIKGLFERLEREMKKGKEQDQRRTR